MFNDLLKATMKQEGITGRKLAELLGDKPALVSYYLQKGSLDETTMTRYADALGYDVDIRLVKRSDASPAPIPQPDTPKTNKPTPAPRPAAVPDLAPAPDDYIPTSFSFVNFSFDQAQEWHKILATGGGNPYEDGTHEHALFEQFAEHSTAHNFIKFVGGVGVQL